MKPIIIITTSIDENVDVEDGEGGEALFLVIRIYSTGSYLYLFPLRIY